MPNTNGERKVVRWSKMIQNEALRNFLQSLEPEVVDYVQWPKDIELRVACYISECVPPLGVVTSVRAVLFTEAGIAVLHNPDGMHILPGGRRETEEPLVETLRREIREETGCEIEEFKLVGFLYLRHLTPRPDGYKYPYPDFVQLVYGARGRVVTDNPVDPDGWEEQVEFVRLDDLRNRPLANDQRLFLEKAVQVL